MIPELYQQMAENQSRHWWFVARRKILAKTLASLKLPAKAQILEIGCGTGGNLTMLQSFGEVSGIEHDAFAREYAKQISEINVSKGSLPDKLSSDKKFDLICLFDVIEHIEDDTGSLKTVKNLLKPDGKIVVTVPAYMWLFSSHDMAHGHFRRYTASELSDKASQLDLAVLRTSYFNCLLFPLAGLKRTLDLLWPGKMKADSEMPSPFINYCLQGLFAMEARIIDKVRMPFGLSVMAIYKLPS